MSTTTTTQKKVLGTYGPGSSHWVGDGFPVRNLFPSNGIQLEVSPFLMLDYAGPQYFKPAPQPRGVGEHPHRGFETVTIAYQGSVGTSRLRWKLRRHLSRRRPVDDRRLRRPA